MNDTLYIIGNGFDLHHGLKTSYQTFAFYLQDHYEQVYEYLTSYFGLPHLDREKKEDSWNPLWAEFEKTLADLDFETVLDDNTDYLPNIGSPDFRDRDWHTYQVEIESVVDRLTSGLFIAFKEFILNVEYPALRPESKLEIDKNALFLNFNYTNTLGSYYGIEDDNILFIHNEAMDEEAELVLGHGVHPDNFKFKLPEPPEGISDEDLEEWRQEMGDRYSYSYVSGQHEIRTYFSKSFKQTKTIIKNNIGFFEMLKEVRNIIVIGHSLSEVDELYIKKVNDCIKSDDAIWTVTYYSESAKDSHKEKLLSLGLSESQINVVHINDLTQGE